MDFDIDNLEMLKGVQQLKELKRQKELFNLVFNKAQMDAYTALSKEADTRDPNRVKHYLAYEDVEAIVVNVAKLGVQRGAKNNRENKSLLTVKFAIDGYVKKENKHTEWAQKVKHRGNYGASVKSAILSLSSGNVEVECFFRGIDKTIVNDSFSLNKALTKLVEEHERVMKMTHLVQDNKLKTEKIISLEAMLLVAENEISELKAGVIIQGKDDWRAIAIPLLRKGVKRATVATTVGKSKSTIQRLMNEFKCD
jgi:hypothetical protein